MHSTQPPPKEANSGLVALMTQKEPVDNSKMSKSGIALQSSQPLYTKNKPDFSHGHEKKNDVTPLSDTPVISSQTRKETTQYIPQEKKQVVLDHYHHDGVHNLDHAGLGHNQGGHDHSHDHNHHDHNHHDHSHHDHSHHDHNHHDHSHHDHSHHDQGHLVRDHHHDFTPVYTRPLPSWMEVFAHLAPAQKTIFTWFLLHSVIGIWLYCMGTSRESLSLVGLAYLMIFDALGVLNSFVSSILRTNPAFGVSNTKRPFGAHRYEIVFGLGTTIYLMFATMHNTKEALHHALLQDHHKVEVHEKEDHHVKFSLGMFFLVGFAITATCVSSIALRNHDNFVRYLRRRPTTVHGFSYNVINRARGNPIHALLSNIYSLSIVLCGSIVLISYMFGIVTPFVDSFLALSESAVMFYLGYPTAKALAKVLLQTTPNSVQNGVDNRLREIQQNPNILQVDRIHFWQTTYGKCVGTIEIHIRPDADEQSVLQFVYQKLEGLTSSNPNSDESHSELTVSIVK